MGLKFTGSNWHDTVTVRAISGHPTGVTIPAAQKGAARAKINDPSTATGRSLAGSQPNTDRRRFVTHY